MSKDYRKWVAEQPCACCGRSGLTQAAHYQGLRASFYGRGKGIKADDMYLAPLCMSTSEQKGCHAKFDDYEMSDQPTRMLRQIDQSEQFQHYILLTIAEAQRQGVQVG